MVDHSILLNIKQHGPVESGIAVTQGDHGKTRLAMRVKDGDDVGVKSPYSTLKILHKHTIFLPL